MSHSQSRRKFLQQSAGVAAAGMITPYIFTGAARAEDAKTDRPLVGQIGCGGMGNGDTKKAKQFGNIVAVCDVDSQRAEQSKKDNADGKGDVYGDYRRVLDRKDISVVIVATPDHWHTKIAIEAMQAGKDVYCEKPLTLTIDEGKQICKVLKETGRVFQVGTQQRSEGLFAQAVAMVRDGRVGKVKKVTVAIGGAETSKPIAAIAPPPTLNWDMWLGQAPKVDYLWENQDGRAKTRCHYEFRWWYEYSGGKMTDWGAHHVDIAHWVIGAADTGPLSIEGTATHPVPYKDGYPTIDNQYNTATKFNVLCKFADGVELNITDTQAPEFDNGVMIEGDAGRIFVNRQKITGKPVEELKDKPLPEDAITKLYKGKQHGHHMRNFFECIKTREQPISDVYSHHRAMTTCHLANICIRLGRALKWDPATEQIVGDDDANKWQKREQRKGFEIVS